MKVAEVVRSIVRLLVLALAFSASTITAAADEVLDPATQQSSCKFPVGLSGFPVHIQSAFYVEKNKVAPLGSVVKKGDPLFYVQLAEAKKLAHPVEPIYNRDPSPLNADFTLEPSQTYTVPFAFTENNVAYYDVLYLKRNFLDTGTLVPIRGDGTLCSNMLHFKSEDRQRPLLIEGGMPRIYQSKPLTFEYVETPHRPMRAVAIVLKDVDGATMTVSLTVLKDGKSVKQEVSSFDLLGGTAKVGSLVLTFARDGDGVKVNSIAEPQNYSTWLHTELAIPR